MLSSDNTELRIYSNHSKPRYTAIILKLDDLLKVACITVVSEITVDSAPIVVMPPAGRCPVLRSGAGGHDRHR